MGGEVVVGGSAVVVFGNAGGKGPGEFALNLTQECKDAGFSVDAATGSVDGGQSKEVTITFKPTRGGGGVGRWLVFEVPGSLKKWVPPPAKADGKPLVVVV